MEKGAKKRPKPKPHKTLIIYEGNRPRVVAFVDETQERMILTIIDKGHQMTQ